MSNEVFSRRNLLQTGALLAAAGAPALAQQGPDAPYNPHPAARIGQPQEGPDTPKITTGITDPLDDAEAQRLKQIGINWVSRGSAPAQPWTMDFLRPQVEALAKHDMHLGIIMIRWSGQGASDPDMAKIVYGLPGRDEVIGRIKDSIVNCGKLGIPVVEYNFYNHRASEGYARTQQRGGATSNEFKIERLQGLPPGAGEGTHTYEETWDHLAYFLKSVIPVAEKANVALSLHPNDPPAPMSHGSAQIMNSFSDWKRLIQTVDSPSNCITWDSGVSRELGEDPVAVGNWFASRNRIGQVHFRNVVMRRPRADYTEVFPDVGDNDMYEIMKMLVKNNYKRMIYPEHPAGLDVDEKLGRGFGSYAAMAYNIGHCRAMLQIALRQVRGL